jgi:ABC-type antimicrobial peptide transport system permease subunit
MAGEEPIGKRFTFAGEGIPLEVVGVSRNATYQEIGESPKPLVYLSMVQYYFPTAVMYVRAVGDPAPVVATVKRELQLLDRNLLLQAETLDVSIRELLWVQRLSSGLLAIFGVLALLLSTIGIYGVISYSVRQRKRELGIRIALGATPKDVRSMILREGIRLVAIGVIAGTILALSAAQSVAGMLVLRHPRDVFTFTLVPSVLVLVGLLACWGPAGRAMRIDPAIALRDE